MCKHPSESNNIDYDKITADAIQNHNDVLKDFEFITENLEALDSNRDLFSENIVTPAGDIIIPQLFPTAADKIQLLELADKYFATANETEKNLRTITRIHQSTLGRNAALALTTEVHRLLHSEGEIGDLLRDLDNKELLKVMVVPKPNKGEHTISFSPDWKTKKDDEKRALLKQASEKLRAKMSAYPQDTLKAMVTYAFKDQTDESVWHWDSFYLLYTNKFSSIEDAKIYRNMQSFASIIAELDNSISEYKKAENPLYDIINSAVKKYKSAQKSTQE